MRLRKLLRLGRIGAVLAEGALYAGWIAGAERLGLARLALRQQLTWRFMRHLQASLPFFIEVRGELPARPALWLCNHVSWVDIAVLGAICPLSFLSKAEVAGWPLAGWLARQAGTLFIDRGAADTRSLTGQMSGYLQQQAHLLIFPEGTSSDGRDVLRFHPRLLAAALDSGAPIQPVALRYRRHGEADPLTPFIGDDELPGHLLRLLDAERAIVEIVLLPVLDSSGLSRTELARRAHAAIAAEVRAPELRIGQFA